MPEDKEKDTQPYYIKTLHDKRRNIDHWILSEFSDFPNAQTLIQAHNDIADMFINSMPFILFLAKPPLNDIGKLSNSAYLISHEDMPDDSPIFLMNNEFFKYCTKGASCDAILDILSEVFKPEKLEEYVLKYGLCVFVVKETS